MLVNGESVFYSELSMSWCALCINVESRPNFTRELPNQAMSVSTKIRFLPTWTDKYLSCFFIGVQNVFECQHPYPECW